MDLIKDSPKYDHFNQVYIHEQKEDSHDITQDFIKDLGEKKTLLNQKKDMKERKLKLDKPAQPTLWGRFVHFFKKLTGKWLTNDLN